jgi:hypothetical protein
MHLVLIVLSAVVALGSLGLVSSGHRSAAGSASQTNAAFVCPTPPPDDLLGGQPSHC